MTSSSWFACFPLFFVGMWTGVSLLLARLGGWQSLARAYPPLSPPSGQSFRFRSGRLGMTNYNSCLRFVAGPAGLAMSILFFFRIGHAPLFVPWTDVSVRFHKGWVLQYADFRFAKSPEVRLRVMRELGERLLAAGGNVVRPTETA